VKATQWISAVLVAALAGAPALAHASTDVGALNTDAFDLSGALDRAVSPTRTALEVALGVGYTQGVGGAGAAGNVEDITGAGGSLEAQIGVRLIPSLAVGMYGTYARFRHGDAFADGSNAQAITAGIQATWHARPARSLDPWISLGTGWRGLWLSPAGVPSSSLQGIELARLQLGVDYRLSPRFAVSPVIGASASLFVAQDSVTTNGLMALHDNRLNLYGFTGLVGRFDVGG
jgi:hypothetical protein